MVLDVRAYLRNVFEHPSRGCEPERTAGIADSSRQLGVVREVYSGDPLAVCIVEFVGRLDVAGGCGAPSLPIECKKVCVCSRGSSIVRSAYIAVQ